MSKGRSSPVMDRCLKARMTGIVLHQAGIAFTPPLPSVPKAGCPRKGMILGGGGSVAEADPERAGSYRLSAVLTAGQQALP